MYGFDFPEKLVCSSSGEWQMRNVLYSVVAVVFLSSLALAEPGDDSKGITEKTINDLSSENGQHRIAATKTIFGKGKDALATLQDAGAKQVSPFGTIATRRIDIVYSLLDGLRTNKGGRASYLTNSFGLHLEKGATEKDVIEMGRKYGFTISGTFNQAAVICYVKLKNGKKLDAVLKAVLVNEPDLVTVNLNYIEY